MRIGDKVRLLRGTEEGRIVSIKGKIVDVEIDDGFIIPTMLNEVVLIDKNEANSFEKEISDPGNPVPEKNDDLIADGIYLGFEDIQESFFESYFINQTTDTVLFSLSQYDKKVCRSVAHGICEAYQRQSTGKLTSSIFNESKRLVLQMIVLQKETRRLNQPLNIELQIKKDRLNKTAYITSPDKQLILFNIAENQDLTFDPQVLQEKMMTGAQKTDSKKDKQNSLKELTADLHFENLSVNLKPDQILEYQLAEFEKYYDRALVLNVEKLKIIHGVGAGILRSEIHKRLSSKKEVNYFEDSDKERFGFGSTVIYF